MYLKMTNSCHYNFQTTINNYYLSYNALQYINNFTHLFKGVLNVAVKNLTPNVLINS